MKHCWAGKAEHMEKVYGWGSEQWADCFANDNDGICMLEDGHKGEHEWTPASQIIIQF